MLFFSLKDTYISFGGYGPAWFMGICGKHTHTLCWRMDFQSSHDYTLRSLGCDLLYVTKSILYLLLIFCVILFDQQYNTKYRVVLKTCTSTVCTVYYIESGPIHTNPPAARNPNSLFSFSPKCPPKWNVILLNLIFFQISLIHLCICILRAIDVLNSKALDK